MNEKYLAQLRNVVNSMEESTPPDLGDDALIYANAATWEMWQNHVPDMIRSMWPLLCEETRLAVYMTAKSVTGYESKSRR